MANIGPDLMAGDRKTGSAYAKRLAEQAQQMDTGAYAGKLDQANKIARLKQISGLWEQFPGRAPGGTGLTGLGTSDSQGWSNVLNEQTEAQNLVNSLTGKDPAQVRQAALRENHVTNGGTNALGSLAAENYAEDPAWWLMGDSNGSGDNRDPLSRIPPSVLGLYAAARK